MRYLAPILMLCCLAGVPVLGAAPTNHVEIIAALAHSKKVATLKEHGAVKRVQKITYYLADACRSGLTPDIVLDQALRRTDYKLDKLTLTKAQLLMNLRTAIALGCLDEPGMKDMKQGRSPTIRVGPDCGDELSVDYIIPITVCPEADKVLANLRFTPSKKNQSESGSVGAEQVVLAQKLHGARLLSTHGLRLVLTASNKN